MNTHLKNLFISLFYFFFRNYLHRSGNKKFTIVLKLLIVQQSIELIEIRTKNQLIEMNEL